MSAASLIVDLFAGGGGASEGIRQALGRSPDIAINHDAEAIAVHTRNHPETEHICASVWDARPEQVCQGRPVDLLWASPDCRHFSRAAGGLPRWQSVRSLPGVVITWATRARPRVIVVENVREMLGWGPLLADGTPCPQRIGRSWAQWIGRLRGLGYQVQWRELCAADYGTPTIRTRLFVVARCDGAPITWPAPSHARLPSLFERPWRTAGETIDWSIPCRSIFTRARPLRDATLRRIADGIMRHVVNSAEPFVVNFYGTSRTSSVRAPLGSITAQGEHHALVAAHMTPITHHKRRRGSACTEPVPTITTAHRGEQMLIAAYLAQHNTGVIGRAAAKPLSTITTTAAQQAVVEASLSNADRDGARRVAAFLMRYYGSGGQLQGLDEPLGSVTTRDRFALVTVDGVPHPITDIGMRMLTPRELASAQGFDPSYDLSDGGRLTKTSQIRLIGNSVCPDVAAAVVRANLSPVSGASTGEEAAA